MASLQKIVTLDIGGSTLKLSELGIGKDGSLTLIRFGVEELGVDPNKEEDRSKFITPALTKLLKTTGIRSRKVHVSVSGQSTFTKFIKLPNVDASQIEKMVVFEAQQNVPFPINEVVWDYQMIVSRPGSTESECVIVAIKKDVLDYELAAVEAAGVKVVKVDVAPFALLNSFRYTNGDSEGCSMIINMGARSTNLIFVEGGKYWVRTFPIAGNQVTQHLCNELQEPFSAAETLKRGKGFVSLGGVYADPPDEMAARISKLIRATMTRLHIEVNRSISFWRTTFGGSAPKRVFLYGGGSQIPYLNFFIQDKLNIPVEYFNPLSNVNINPALDANLIKRDYCYSAECMGIALRASGGCPAEITLDSPRILDRVVSKRVQPYYIAALFVWVILLVGLCLYTVREIALAQDTLDERTSTSTKVQGLSRQLAPKVVELNRLQLGLTSVQDLAVDRERWINVLDQLNDKIPVGIWFSAMSPKSEPPRPAGHGPGMPPPPPVVRGADGPIDQVDYLDLQGLYHDNDSTQHLTLEDISQFITNLKDCPDFSIDTDISQILTMVETRAANPDPLALSFPLKLRLKHPIRIQPGS